MNDKKNSPPGAFKKGVAKVTNIRALNFIELKLLYIISAGFVLIGDVMTKAVAVALKEMGQIEFPLIEGFIDFVYMENLGMAAGTFSRDRLLFIVPSIIMMFVIFLYLIFDNGWNPAIGISLSMILGGGVGNLIERVSGDGTVVDFIYVVPLNFFPFNCIFNVADVFVCLGAGILIFELIKSILWDIKAEVTGTRENPVVSAPKWIKFFFGDSNGEAAEKLNVQKAEETEENKGSEDNG